MSADDASGRPQKAAWSGQPPLPSAAPALYAGVIPRRILGYLVDIVVIAVLGLCLGFVLSVVGLLTFGLLSPLAVIIMALWPLLYHSYFVATRGATPGMQLFDLEIRAWSGRPVEPVQAVLVVLLFFVTIALTAWLILVIALFTDRNRTLHDILAGTVVVRRQS
jgi:uncharacterized RDD family membrane protein YckC